MDTVSSFEHISWVKKPMSDYCHLHLHSIYSIRDGISHLDKIVDKIKSLGQKSLAVTDHGGISGSVKLFNLCVKNEIKFVLGLEAYICTGDYRDHGADNRETFHTTLLADGVEGYQELIKLITISNTEGFYRKPRMNLELLSGTKHLFALSGCVNGPIPQAILNKKPMEEIHKLVDSWKKALPGRFFMEITNNGFDIQDKVNSKIMALAKHHDLKVIPTNDSHAVDQDDTLAQSLMMNIGDENKDEDGNINLECKDLNGMFIRSRQEVGKAIESLQKDGLDVSAALDATVELADRLKSPDLSRKLPRLPKYIIPKKNSSYDEFCKMTELKHNPASYLRFLTFDGWSDIFNNPSVTKVSDEIAIKYAKKAEFELKIIEKFKLEEYFLMVFDILDYCRKNEIDYGPGRGSVCGSLVAFLTGITQIDPIKYDLIFERFLNPARMAKGELPDIDLDIVSDRRAEVIDYIKDKYGHEKVARLVTFSTMQSKAAISHVGNVLEIPFPKIKKITKQIPAIYGKVTKMKDVVRLKSLESLVSENKELFDLATKLEGCVNAASTHASAVIICNEDISTISPLVRPAKSKVPVVGFDMWDSEHLGLIKLDVLGLTELTIIREVKKLIHGRTGINLDLSVAGLDLADDKTWRLIRSGQTLGIFQLTGKSTSNVVKSIRPDNIDELAVCNSLSRPGALTNKSHLKYASRKTDPTTVKHLHPKLESILGDTYGLIVFQEQILRIAMSLCNLTAADAETLRKGIGKKQDETVKQVKEMFIEGAVKNDVDRVSAETIWSVIEPAKDYLFNKSHALGYSMISYQGAYVKAHYPIEFYAAAATQEITKGGKDSGLKVVDYLNEMRRRKIEFIPPSVQVSSAVCRIDDENRIILPLCMIKDVGQEISKQVGEMQPFSSMEDFYTKIDRKYLRKDVIFALAEAGAFEDIEKNRRGVQEGHAYWFDKVKRKPKPTKTKRKRKSTKKPKTFDITMVKDFLPVEKAQQEIKRLGVCVKTSIFEGYRKNLNELCSVSPSIVKPSEMVWMGAMVKKSNIHVDKNEDDMMFLDLTDGKRDVPAIIFASSMKNVPQKSLVIGAIIRFYGHLDNKGQFMVDKAKLIPKDGPLT